jgi:flagellar motility protein MotE (MotC chaperone)
MAETKEQTLKDLQERISVLENQLEEKTKNLEKKNKSIVVKQVEFSNSVQPDPKFN